MDDNTGRVLTIRLTITDPEEADWIWKAHPNPIHGVIVSAISNGDMFQERDMLVDAAAYYIREEGETTEEAIEAHCFGNKGFDTPEEAILEAKETLSPETVWDVVDRKGNVFGSRKAPS